MDLLESQISDGWAVLVLVQPHLLLFFGRGRGRDYYTILELSANIPDLVVYLHDKRN